MEMFQLRIVPSRSSLFRNFEYRGRAAGVNRQLALRLVHADAHFAGKTPPPAEPWCRAARSNRALDPMSCSFSCATTPLGCRRCLCSGCRADRHTHAGEHAAHGLGGKVHWTAQNGTGIWSDTARYAALRRFTTPGWSAWSLGRSNRSERHWACRFWDRGR